MKERTPTALACPVMAHDEDALIMIAPETSAQAYAATTLETGIRQTSMTHLAA